jgi:PTS system nitrogen regulatory IIA component
MNPLAVMKPSLFINSRKAAKLNTIAHYLRPEDILLDTDVSSKPELLDTIGRHMEQAHSLPRESVSPSLARREQLGSTGLGQGVAIPHARVKDLNRILVAYLRMKSPIPYDAPDGEPVSEILVLMVPKQATEEHLRILADASRMFANRQFRRRLRQCSDPQAVKQLFDAWSGSPSWLH